MKKHGVGLLAFLVLGLISYPAAAQEWDIYESEEFDLQFSIPADWETVVEEDMITAAGDGIVFVLGAVKDESISTLELFEIQVDALEVEAEGEYEELELAGGIQAVIGSGPAVIDGEVVALILLAATLDENNYIAYIFVDPEMYDAYEDLMVEVITSMQPLDR